MRKLMFALALIVILSGCAPRGPVALNDAYPYPAPLPAATDIPTPTIVPWATKTPPPLTPRWRIW
jgi:hypothetical protein